MRGIIMLRNILRRLPGRTLQKQNRVQTVTVASPSSSSPGSVLSPSSSFGPGSTFGSQPIPLTIPKSSSAGLIYEAFLKNPIDQILMPVMASTDPEMASVLSQLGPDLFDFDIVKLARKDQESSHYKPDVWKEAKLKDIFPQGSFICQMYVNPPEKNIHDITTIGASKYFTTGCTFSEMDLTKAKKAMQIFTPIDPITGEHSKPSRQIVVFFKITEEILEKFGNLKVAVGHAINNPSIEHELSDGTKKEYKIGEGNAVQIFIPYKNPEPKFDRHKRFFDALLLNARFTLFQPCETVRGHDKTRTAFESHRIAVDPETGAITRLSSRKFERYNEGVIELGPVPTEKPAVEASVTTTAVATVVEQPKALTLTKR